jgi:hypothetical protein
VDRRRHWIVWLLFAAISVPLLFLPMAGTSAAVAGLAAVAVLLWLALRMTSTD